MLDWLDYRSKRMPAPPRLSSSLCLLPAAPALQGNQRFEAGVLTFRNNYAMQQAYQGMPDRWAVSACCADVAA